ncbi:MAG: M14 family metallopeptidase [Armatimonadota bacterium]
MPGVPDVKLDSYYGYDELTAYLKEAAEAAPELMQLGELLTTPEGRKVWLAEVTDASTGPGAEKPGYYVHGNMHAQELAGATVSLHLLQALLTDDAFEELRRKVVFYIVPRVNPDGAEYAFRTGGPIRSRFDVIPKKNGLVPEDLNGDGLVLQMRWEDPAGRYKEDDEDPRLMVPRRAGDTDGPFYQVHHEGLIQDYDGGPIASGIRSHDFNRNWPMNWSPEHEQHGASDYPFAQPEMHAVGTFMLEHRNIFAGIDFHCGSNSILRPSGVPDEEMDQGDLRLILEIGKIAEELTGFPLLATRDYRESWRKVIQLKGSSNSWAHQQLGISWYVIELGNSVNSAGVPTKEFLEADSETREREYKRKVLAFADEHPDMNPFVPWEEFEHPQLGRVEIGGVKQWEMFIPYAGDMQEIAPNTTEFIRQHAGRHPELVLSDVTADAVAEGLYRIRATAANVGAFSTCVMQAGRNVASNEPVRVRLTGIDDDAVLSRAGLHELPALSGLGGREQFEWFVKAKAGSTMTVEAANPRGGIAREELRLE